MSLGTLGQVAKRLRANRRIIRAAVDAGLVTPIRFRRAGGNRYVRLFDLDAASAAREEIVAALNSGALEPRGPRTFSRTERGSGSARAADAPTASASGRPSAADPLADLWGGKCVTLPPELSRACDVQFRLQRQTSVRRNQGLPPDPELQAALEAADRRYAAVEEELVRQGRWRKP